MGTAIKSICDDPKVKAADALVRRLQADLAAAERRQNEMNYPSHDCYLVALDVRNKKAMLAGARYADLDPGISAKHPSLRISKEIQVTSMALEEAVARRKAVGDLVSGEHNRGTHQAVLLDLVGQALAELEKALVKVEKARAFLAEVHASGNTMHGLAPLPLPLDRTQIDAVRDQALHYYGVQL